MIEIITSKEVVAAQVRRIKAVKVSAELLLCLFQTSPPRVIQCKGVPPDARAVRIGYDAQMNVVICVYEHPSFPECPEGKIPQFLEARFTQYHGDAARRALDGTEPE